MLAQHAQRSLERAAAKTLDRIRTDQERVSGRLRPLLEHIEVHLFDPGLDVNQLKRRCGVRDNSVPIQFHSQLGKPPHAYIEKCRLETACRLLVDTELKVWQIANLLGYSSIQVFSRAFTRWADIRPTAYRRRERRKATTHPARKLAAAVAATKTEVRLGVDTLKAALDGELEASQADRLIRRLLNLYPATGLMLDRPTLAQAASASPEPAQPPLAEAPFRTVPLPAPPGPDYRRLLSLEEIETARAEALWEQIKDLPQDKQRAAIRGGTRFETRALFEVVRKGGLKQGRDDRKRGIEVAELLADVSTLTGNSGSASTSANAKANALTWLANAKRLSFDLAEAEKLLLEAERCLPAKEVSSVVVGDLAQVRSLVQRYRRCYEESLSFSNEAIESYSEAKASDRLAEALLNRAGVYGELDRLDESCNDIEAGVELLSHQDNEFLSAAALNILGWNHCQLGNLESAAEAVERSRPIRERLADTELELKFSWLEAEILSLQGATSNASSLYQDLVARFVEKGRAGEAASAALELANLHWMEGSNREVVGLLADVLPMLQKLQLRKDAIVALSLLQKAALATSLSSELFEKARKKLREPSQAGKAS